MTHRPIVSHKHYSIVNSETIILRLIQSCILKQLTKQGQAD